MKNLLRKFAKPASIVLTLVSSVMSIFGAVELGFDNAAVLAAFIFTITISFFTALYIIEIGEKKIGIVVFLIVMLGLSSLTNISVMFISEMAQLKKSQFSERYEEYLNEIESNFSISKKNYEAKNASLFGGASSDLQAMYAEELNGRYSGIKGSGPTVQAILDTKNFLDTQVAPRYVSQDYSWFAELLKSAKAKNLQNADEVKSAYESLVSTIHNRAPFFVPVPVFDSRVNHFGNLWSLMISMPWIVLVSFALDLSILFFALNTPKKRVPNEKLIKKAGMLAASVMVIDYFVSFYGLVMSGWSWYEISIYMLFITGFGYIAYRIFTRRTVSWATVAAGTAIFLLSAIPDFSTNVLSFAEASKLNAIETHISKEWGKLASFKDEAFAEVFKREFAAYMETSKNYLIAVGIKTGHGEDNTAQAMTNRDKQFKTFESKISNLADIKIPVAPVGQIEAVDVFTSFQKDVNSNFSLQIPVKNWDELVIRVQALVRASTDQPMHVFAAAGLVFLSFGGLLLSFRARKSAVSFKIK